MSAKAKTPRQINAEREKAGKLPLNFALFRKVIKKIETAPDAYDQGAMGAEPDDAAPCGTVACIGGWADILSADTKKGRERRIKNVDLYRAGRTLGLPLDHSLFYAIPDESWGTQFVAKWQLAKTRRSKARLAVGILNRIISTGWVPTHNSTQS